MKILESAENYLESILILRNEKGRVRSIDIVNHLGFSKPSVSIAMKQLEENGYTMLILGYKGHSTMERLLIGSTVNKIVAHAPCSVMVYRPPLDEKEK